MAKKKQTTAEPVAKLYGLRFGHPTIFRRTINLGTKDKPRKVQLVFEPDVPLELSAVEIEALKPELEDGIIAPWHEGKLRRTPAAQQEPRDESKELAALREENELLREQITELTEQLAAATAPADEEVDNDAPIGDE